MEKKRLYFAATMFDRPNLDFNLALTERLEEKDYDVFLPQRDGFEFSKLFGVFKRVFTKMSDSEIENAVNRIIYFVDKGKVANSHVCIARFDEPIDEGEVSEINFALMLDIPAIGFRTDVRTPYGSRKNEVGGMHPFPAYDCTSFIYAPSVTMRGLTKLLDEEIKKTSFEYKEPPARACETIARARKLIEGLDNLTSGDSMKEIARRYVSKQSYFSKALPRFYSPSNLTTE